MWLAEGATLGGGAAFNAGACWRPRKEVMESVGLGVEEAEDAFAVLEGESDGGVCAPAEASTEYYRAVADSFAELGGVHVVDEVVSGRGGWDSDLEGGRHVQRARSLFGRWRGDADAAPDLAARLRVANPGASCSHLSRG